METKQNIGAAVVPVYSLAHLHMVISTCCIELGDFPRGFS
jgi:hypothetical protein